tara:strand:- start:1050 stop:1361 length:312 start_codon:yes stop_codon:yes gene_type:complete
VTSSFPIAALAATPREALKKKFVARGRVAGTACRRAVCRAGGRTTTLMRATARATRMYRPAIRGRAVDASVGVCGDARADQRPAVARCAAQRWRRDDKIISLV